MTIKRASILAGIATAALLSYGATSFADEVTKSTTTTTKTTDPTVVVTPEPVRPAGVVVDDNAGCSTKKVTKTDGDTGDTTKKISTDC